MNYIDIEVYVHNESTKLMDSLDMEYDLENADLKTARLYRIDYILPYEKDGKEYTQIHVADNSFITPVAYNDFKKLVDILFG